MIIRFTEFIIHDNKEFNLYIIQENHDSDSLCFKVHVKDGERGLLFLCKNADNDWNFSPHDNPNWLDAIKPQVIAAIEKRISKVGTEASKVLLKRADR